MRDYIYRLMTDQVHGFAPRAAAVFLGIVSRLYGGIMPLVRKRALRRARKAPVKVISVGNITVGGTGKTPLVGYIVRTLKQDGRKVAVVTRGYRMSSPAGRQAGSAPVADEAAMLADELADVPVIVDANRLRGIRLAYYTYGVDTVVLDDAFQQWRLIRDLDIVCIDARNPFGNRRLLPRGILREEPAALGRADICVLSKADLCPDVNALEARVRAYNSHATIVEAHHRPRGLRRLGTTDGERVDLSSLAGQRTVLFSGIGDPASFSELVARGGPEVVRSMRFDDHHWYTQADLDRIIAEGLRSHAAFFITTHKDAQRIEKSALASGSGIFYVLMIETAITRNEEAFVRRLRDLYTV